MLVIICGIAAVIVWQRRRKRGSASAEWASVASAPKRPRQVADGLGPAGKAPRGFGSWTCRDHTAVSLHKGFEDLIGPMEKSTLITVASAATRTFF